jgi:hypothetical protein
VKVTAGTAGLRALNYRCWHHSHSSSFIFNSTEGFSIQAEKSADTYKCTHKHTNLEPSKREPTVLSQEHGMLYKRGIKLMFLHKLAFEEINVLKELCIVSSRETKLQITFITQISSIISLQNFLAGKIGVGTRACTCVHLPVEETACSVLYRTFCIKTT